ncbi:hypothetical protein LMG18101_05252 [Ralstonia flaminis]|uniref:Uncharacterized protein n=1 Tax=Ralstonia flaminis TaxID=3058597 RepID=A0ABN9JSL3_9RALS|nr:hypothetical protein LMG18101_05252 [Ralstonia sp. LMG 18101]
MRPATSGSADGSLRAVTLTCTVAGMDVAYALDSVYVSTTGPLYVLDGVKFST